LGHPLAHTYTTDWSHADNACPEEAFFYSYGIPDSVVNITYDDIMPLSTRQSHQHIFVHGVMLHKLSQAQ